MSEPTRRQRRKVLTDKMAAALPRKRKRYILADPELRGHYVRVPPQGPCVFAAVARYSGTQVWATLGTADVLKIDEARDKAREAIKRIKAGLSAFEPPPVQPDTVADVAATWLKRHVEAKGLRTGDEMRRVFEYYVLPHWRDHAFASIRRSDIAVLLDSIEDKHGAWVADSVLAVLRAMASWFATRHDDYTPPFVRGMKRVAAHDRKRSRILSDDELRAVWKAAEADEGPFGAFVRVLLLTSQRREKCATMKWSSVSEDGTWTIPTEAREKGNPGSLKLPPLAMAIINAQPHLAGSPFVFTGRHNKAFAGFSRRHDAFKARCGVANWSLHDLRRTARSLMARAGVPTEHAERVLGHARGVIEETYNVHSYGPEKAAALAKLAALIETIVRGEPGNVVPMPMRTPAVQS